MSCVFVFQLIQDVERSWFTLLPIREHLVFIEKNTRHSLHPGWARNTLRSLCRRAAAQHGTPMTVAIRVVMTTTVIFSIHKAAPQISICMLCSMLDQCNYAITSIPGVQLLIIQKCLREYCEHFSHSSPRCSSDLRNCSLGHYNWS